MKEFLKALKSEKIKIRGNRKPVPMKTFLDFLTVKAERQDGDFLGKCNGWTEHFGDDNLLIKGGVVKGVEYLDSIVYKKNLDNPWNNLVNPFYLFEILNEEGKAFFLNYYKNDIEAILLSATTEAERAENTRLKTIEFWSSFGFELNKE
jgi:hypothetical protein